MGPLYVRFAILMHEAAHKLLFTNKRVNDWVGTWLIAYPAFTPIRLYRRGHFAHHREEFGPDEPDLAFYGGYPCTRATLRRRLVRDAVGISGWKNFIPLLRSVRSPSSAGGLSILGVQALMWAAGLGGHRALVDLPALVVAAVDDPVAGAQPAAVDRRARRAGGRAGPPGHHPRRPPDAGARLWLVPYHTGWHLAHHVDMGIPWRNLPGYHDELVRAGYVTDALTYPSYRALWRALSSAPEPAVGTGASGPPAADRRSQDPVGYRPVERVDPAGREEAQGGVSPGPPPHRLVAVPSLGPQCPLEHLGGGGDRHRAGDPDEAGTHLVPRSDWLGQEAAKASGSKPAARSPLTVTMTWSPTTGSGTA